jgi:hypothetical protein
MLARFILKLASPRFRYILYIFLGIFFLCSSAILSALQMRYDGIFTFIRSDGRAYYIYLPALVLDGDLDFSNQLQNPWNIAYQPLNPEVKTELGFIKNKYPVGLAMTIAAPFLLAHGVSKGLYRLTDWPAFAPNGYSVLYQLLCAGFIMALGVISMIFVDRLLTGRFRLAGKIAAASVLTFWIGSQYAYYFFREPFMVHIVSGFWVTASILLVDHMLSRLDSNELSLKDCFLLILSLSMAMVCRPTNLFIMPFLLYLGYQLVQRGMLARLLKMAPFCLIGLLPIIIQMAVWYKTTGHFISWSYGEEGFIWLLPALGQTILSSRHGLLVWSPLVGFSAAGFIMSKTRHRGFLSCYLLSFVVLWYLNSAWHTWWFGDAFGARAFLELSSLFILGLGLFIEHISRSGRAVKVLASVGILICVCYNWSLMALYILSRIPRGDYLF